MNLKLLSLLLLQYTKLSSAYGDTHSSLLLPLIFILYQKFHTVVIMGEII